MAPSTTTDTTALRALLHSWEKGLRTLSIYLPNNPVRQQTIDALQEGLSGLWQQLPEFTLTVSEDGLEWKSEIVLPVENKSESLAWTLFRDGIRWMVFSPGAEEEEIVTFLNIIQRARTLTDEDEEDLRTLLWSADFQFIRYKVAELGEVDGAPIQSAPSGQSSKLSPEAVRDLLWGDVGDQAEEVQEEAEEENRAEGPEDAQEEGEADAQEEAEADAQEEGEPAAQEGQSDGQAIGDAQGAAPVPKGVVNLAEYESTLYFLDEPEIDYLRDEVRREYAQNLNENVLSMLFDIFEEQPDAEVRADIIAILSDLLPHLLNAGDFHSVTYLISETLVVLNQAEDILPEHKQLLTRLTMTFSRPDAVEQLLEALDVATIQPSIDETKQVFAHLTPDVLSTVLKWHGRLSNKEMGETLDMAAGRMAQQSSAAVGVALASSERVVVVEALRLVKEGGLKGVEDQLVDLVEHKDVGIRNALARALAAVPSSATMKALVWLIEDGDPEVRTVAVKGLAKRRYKGALPVLERVVLGTDLRSRDLTEARAFFRAYGTIAGESAVANLKEILLPKAFWRSSDSDRRACAALALGHIPSQAARGALQRATKDKQLVVRSAAMRALRQADKK